MKLKNVEFVLENCDRIIVDGKYIGDFIVEDIETSIRRVGCNAIIKMDIANTVAIEIEKGANKKHHAFECESFDPDNVFDRLCECDITRIKFDLMNEYQADNNKLEDHYNYYVDWVGDDDYVNEAQTTYISECDNLYLVISEGKSIDDFFNKEEINDEACMDFTFGMYGVGKES